MPKHGMGGSYGKSGGPHAKGSIVPKNQPGDKKSQGFDKGGIPSKTNAQYQEVASTGNQFAPEFAGGKTGPNDVRE